MPENITPINFTYELPHGACRMIQIDSESDAAYYANGHKAYLYKSRIIKAMYLFVPVMEQA